MVPPATRGKAVYPYIGMAGLAQKLGRTDPLVPGYNTNNSYNLLVITLAEIFTYLFSLPRNNQWRWELLFLKKKIFQNKKFSFRDRRQPVQNYIVNKW